MVRIHARVVATPAGYRIPQRRAPGAAWVVGAQLESLDVVGVAERAAAHRLGGPLHAVCEQAGKPFTASHAFEQLGHRAGVAPVQLEPVGVGGTDDPSLEDVDRERHGASRRDRVQSQSVATIMQAHHGGGVVDAQLGAPGDDGLEVGPLPQKVVPGGRDAHVGLALHRAVTATRALLKEAVDARAVYGRGRGRPAGGVVARRKKAAVVAPLHTPRAAEAAELLEGWCRDDLLHVAASQTRQLAGLHRRGHLAGRDDTLEVLGAEHRPEAGAPGGVTPARDEAGERQQTLAGGADHERFALPSRSALGERREGDVCLEPEEVAGVAQLNAVRAQCQRRETRRAAAKHESRHPGGVHGKAEPAADAGAAQQAGERRARRNLQTRGARGATAGEQAVRKNEGVRRAERVGAGLGLAPQLDGAKTTAAEHEPGRGCIERPSFKGSGGEIDIEDVAKQGHG